MSNSTVPPDVPVSKEILLLVGPLLAGGLLSFMFFGISIVQLYFYYLQFSRDPLLIQFSVYMVFVLDIFQSVSVWALVWRALCSGWGRPAALTFPGWSFSALPAVTGIVSAWVQIFYAWRIYMMINWKSIPIVTIVLALAQAAGALSVATGFIPLESILLAHNLFPRTIVWLGGAALTDMIISVSMVYVLYSAKKNALERTGKVLNRLIRSTVETGVVTTLCAVVELGFFLGLPTTNIHLIFAMILSKLYSNTLMTSLNSRGVGVGSSQGLKNQGWNNAGPVMSDHWQAGTPLGVIHVSTAIEVDRHSQPKKQVE